MRRLLPVGLCLLGSLGACSESAAPEPLKVVSWTGEDGKPVALDQLLKVEFDRPLAKPLRASAVQLLDEGNHPVAGIEMQVVGRWLQLQPSLPLQPDLRGGSLEPGATYAIHLHGLPWLRALTAEDGQRLSEDLALRFSTAEADFAGALTGRGHEPLPLRIEGSHGREPLAFLPGEPILLHFSRGLDPRSLQQPAWWRPQGQGDAIAAEMRLVSNHFDDAVVEVILEDWQGWGVLELPAGIEDLGGRPLPESGRLLHLVRRGS